VEIVDLKRFGDDGGTSLSWAAREGMHAVFPGFECKQINYSEMDRA